jgi:Na+/H+-dicarboxylate symporter
MFIKKFLNLPSFILVLFITTMYFGHNVDVSIKSQLLAVSLSLKDLIIFVLPILIFSFVMGGILNFKNESIKVILIVVPLVCLSNFTGFWVSYTFTAPILKTGIIAVSKLESQNALYPAWGLKIIPIVKNDIALLLGATMGLLGNFLKVKFMDKVNEKLNFIANFILKKLICPVLPLFITGFVMKMQHEGTLNLMIKDYSLLLGVFGILTYGYMFTLLFFLSNRNFHSAINKFKNLLPSILIGLCTTSSASAIPVTIDGSEKNLKDKSIARFIVPTTANMHLLGDCIAIPIIGLALMISFGYGIPSVGQYFIFTLYGVVTKFAGAGIPGGSVLVFLPVFENVFGFSAPMLTALTALYVLFDPIATSANVFGHGLFAILFEKVYNKIFKKKEH